MYIGHDDYSFVYMIMLLLIPSIMSLFFSFNGVDVCSTLSIAFQTNKSRVMVWCDFALAFLK